MKLNSKNIFESQTELELNTINEAVNQVGFEINNLLETSEEELIDLSFSKIDDKLSNYSFLSSLNSSFENVKKYKNEINISEDKWRTYIPKINWYGSKNQYHLWLFGNCLLYTSPSPRD